MKNVFTSFSQLMSLIVTLLIPALLTSCIKNKNEADIVADKTNILTTGIWRFTGYKYTSASSDITYADLPDCRKDDLRSFKNDRTGQIDEGPSKCNNSDPQSVTCHWQFLDVYAYEIEIDSKKFIVDWLTNNDFRIHTSTTDPYAPVTVYVFSK